MNCIESIDIVSQFSSSVKVLIIALHLENHLMVVLLFHPLPYLTKYYNAICSAFNDSVTDHLSTKGGPTNVFGHPLLEG